MNTVFGFMRWGTMVATAATALIVSAPTMGHASDDDYGYRRHYRYDDDGERYYPRYRYYDRYRHDHYHRHCRRVCDGYVYWHYGHRHCDGHWRRVCHGHSHEH